jgi:polyferredoxin
LLKSDRRKNMKNKQIKEPIQKKWIWVVLVLILLAIVPWYFPKNAVEPFILGFPLWAFISTVFSIVLCAYLSWLCVSQWNIVEDEEEAERLKEVKK